MVPLLQSCREGRNDLEFAPFQEGRRWAGGGELTVGAPQFPEKLKRVAPNFVFVEQRGDPHHALQR